VRSRPIEFARSPSACENRLAFLDLPTHFAEGIDAVGRLIEGKPIERALCQDAIEIFFFLHNSGLEFADAGNIEIFRGIQDHSLLAVFAVRVIGPLMHVLVARHDRVIKRVSPVWNDILGFQIPVLQRRIIPAVLKARLVFDLARDRASSQHKASSAQNRGRHERGTPP